LAKAGKGRLPKLLVGIGLVVVIAVALPLMGGCLPTPEEAAPPEEAPPEEAPPEEVAPPDAYEEYVAGLPAGCLPVPREAFEQAIEEGELYIYEWAGWWPEEIFEGFSEEFGIEVIRDNFAGTAEVKTKFSLYPETPYDMVTGLDISDFVPLREVGAAQQINHDWIPNVIEYTLEELMELDYDPGLNYSVPTDMYFVGYAHNTKYVDDPRIPSWSVLFEPEDRFKGRITLLDNAVMTIGATLKYLGYDWFSDNEAELMEAKELLLELKPHVMAFDSWPTLLIYGDEALISGIFGYGDGWFMNDEYEAVVPALPTEGSNLGIDVSFHPIGSPNPAAAHLFQNYLFRPEVNALLIEAIWYSPVHTAVLDLLSADFQEKVALPEGYLDKCDPFDPRAITGIGLELRTAIWEEMKR